MQVNTVPNVIAILSPLSLVILTTLLLTLIYFVFKDKGLPPGSVGRPYFGFSPFMNNTNCHLKLHEIKQKYGEISSFTCTGKLYINLGSIKATREALIHKSDFFGDRVTDCGLMSYVFMNGIAFIIGEHWKVARKFFPSAMKERDANSIKSRIAGSLYDSIKSTIDDLKAKKGEPINLIELFTTKCNTILRLTLFGEVGITEQQIKKFNE
ncbi:cytochrome P450 2B12-like [Argiope bruennichi]|uniref:Cytochrome P450 2B12 like protein n=1 Tax=Argiope bruennichi TaxID=94029 RepID=A0A8T0E2U6_ARGBR|nr:cytochrome P450 2B12-like [Argiope bruennichi]KAF8764666.1 Cytochrome P450 2B12 like protein [Argiope bruennichi]